MPGNLLLLADSRPFFAQPEVNLITNFFSARQSENPLVIYVGAANGDKPEFAEMARFIVHRFLGNSRFVHLRTEDVERARDQIAEAGFLFLAGGDPQSGWQFLSDFNLTSIIRSCFESGLSVLGISAGAVLCGHGPDTGSYLQLAPWLIGAHEESCHWQSLLTRQNHRPELDAAGLAEGSILLLNGKQTKIYLNVNFFPRR